MAKILQGKVVKTKMKNTVVVAVESRRPHPLYRKLVKKTTRLKVDTNNIALEEGQMVRIAESRPMSRSKHFKILEVIAK